ncbi:MAG: outer membrane protein transport protein [Acidobacteria bacterium]|nr:outer membrane protein transport protein [Acidobacteriota bacterium]
MHLRSAVLVVSVFLAFCPGLRASAFSINELGARAMGMAGAFVAIADDGSALYYNPAGIAFQKGLLMEMDSLAVVGLFRFKPSDTPPGQYVPTKGFNMAFSPKLIPVSNLYMTKSTEGKWAFGFGAFAPFGLAANSGTFKDSDPPLTKFVGRYAGTRPRLESIWLQPTVAYRINDNNSLALGVALVHTHLLIEKSFLNPRDDAITFGEVLAPRVFPGLNKDQAARSIARLLPEGRSRVAGTSNSPGFVVGYLMKKPGANMSFGIMYRSAVTHHLEGKASFAFTDDYALKSFIGADTVYKLFPTQPVKGKFTTPSNLQVGVAKSMGSMTVAFDFQLQDFNRFKTVPLTFTQTARNAGTALPDEQTLVFDFVNSYQLHFGVEKRWSDKMVVRAGYTFDHTPVPDKSVGPFFPDSSRNNLTFGVSRQRRNMEFSFFYQAMFFRDRTTNVAANAVNFTNGLYSTYTNLFGLGLRLNVGGTTIGATR